MAYAVLLSLEKSINHILSHDSYSFSAHQKQQIMSMDKNITLLRAFLEDFPEKANSRLEEVMREIANKAEDTIEYFMYEDNETRLKLEQSLTERIMEIDLVAREVMTIMNSGRIKDEDSPAAATSSSKLSPSHKKDVMVGFNDDLMAIKEQLCGESSKLQIIPIVGMGGIGKTTLALNAFHDPLIIEYFQIRAWVTVSQDYSAQKILSDLLVSMKEFDTGRSDQDNEEKVYKTLKGRKYLIVMDDIWSTKAYDDVRRIFPDDHNRSRIMLTTRLTDVAAVCANSSSYLHQMQLLGRYQSWNLLRQKVFKQELCPPELKTIGEEIARSCGGLPLAIVVIAGLLSTISKTPSTWKYIAKHVNLAIATEDEQFENIISLSYTHLPHHLRACFLYMGVFPEDHKILVSKLIKLWVAEDFLKPSESKTPEEIAEEYLDDLVMRSLVLVHERKPDGKIRSCRLHDVIRELCIRKAQQETFLLNVMDQRVPKRSIKDQRRVSINKYICYNQYDHLNCLANIYGTTTRTIIIWLLLDSRFPECLGNFRFLRVLDLAYSYVQFYDYVEIGSIPAQVFDLFHLRYLALDFPIKIPAAISKLQNLQTLVINNHREYLPPTVCLPLEIWSMPQLRHLVCIYFGKLPNPEEGATCALENLQTLSEVTNFRCTESVLKMIPNIRKLGISYHGEEYDEEYHLENLKHMQQLEKLKITVDYYYSSFPMKNASIAFPRTLKKLSLSGEGLPWEHIMKIVGSLPKLQVLKLIYPDFGDDCIWETTDGEFLELKFLLIECLSLEHWISESSHFPSLMYLYIHRCFNLRDIPDGIGEISTLELIHVKCGRKSLMESAKRIQEEQRDYGNDALEVFCVD